MVCLPLSSDATASSENNSGFPVCNGFCGAVDVVLITRQYIAESVRCRTDSSIRKRPLKKRRHFIGNIPKQFYLGMSTDSIGHNAYRIQQVFGYEVLNFTLVPSGRTLSTPI